MRCVARRNDLSVLLLAGVVLLHVVLAPFTKVEESFNLQAIHDVIYHGKQLQHYDHLEFPGVVPRTFLGAICISLLVSPFALIAAVLDLPKFAVQIAARVVLGLSNVTALARLKHAVDASALGPDIGTCFMLLTATQFHLPYYMSRPLPNTIALVITSLGAADWVAGKKESTHRALSLLVAAAIIFRCDVIMLAGLVGLHLLASKRVTVLTGVKTGALTALASVVATLLVDSWFWQKWLWPEGHVLWFNTALNKSHEWGVSPALWYFTSALPRMLHVAYPLAVLGALIDPRVRPIFLVSFGFTALYSNLGHKEVRFLFPVIPLWNLSAAAGMAAIMRSRKKTILRQLISFVLIAGVAAGTATTVIALAASRVNYPGGVALRLLHQLGAERARDAQAAGRNVTVHIDIFPAMTGVSRFGESGAPWVYSKVEGLGDAELADLRYDYLLSRKPQIDGYERVGTVDGFAGIRFNKKKSLKDTALQVVHGALPVRIVTAPAVYIHVIR